MTETVYQTITGVGEIAQAAGALLAALQRSVILGPVVGDGSCRLCGLEGPHSPQYPCGALQAALEAIGPTMQALAKAGGPS